MRKVKGRITKHEGREEGEWEAGVLEENIQELALRVKAVSGSQGAPNQHLLNSDGRCEARWHLRVAGAEWRDSWSVNCEARMSSGWSGCPQGGWREVRESRTMR